MEEELTRKVSQFKSILDKADQERLAEIEPSMDDLEVRKYIQDVIRETRQVRNGHKGEDTEQIELKLLNNVFD